MSSRSLNGCNILVFFVKLVTLLQNGGLAIRCISFTHRAINLFKGVLLITVENVEPFCALIIG